MSSSSLVTRLFCSVVALFSGFASVSAGDLIGLPLVATFPSPIGMKLAAGVEGSISLGYIHQKVWHGNGGNKPRIVGVIDPARVDFLSADGFMRPHLSKLAIMNLVDDGALPDPAAEGKEIFLGDLAFVFARLTGTDMKDSEGSSVRLILSYPLYVDFLDGNDNSSGIKFYVGAPMCPAPSDSIPDKMAYCGKTPTFSLGASSVTGGSGSEYASYDIWYTKNPYSQYDDGMWIVLGNDPVSRGFAGEYNGTYLSVKPGARSGSYEGEFPVYLKIM